MEVVKMRVTCNTCGRWSDLESISNAPVSVVTAAMDAMRCPHCGSKNLGLGGGDDAEVLRAGAGTTILMRLAVWRCRGNVGISSSTIANSFQRTVPIPGGHPNVPQDPVDFKRCCDLLTLIPEWLAKLAVVSSVYPFWQPFVAAWAELAELWEEESPSGACPKLYARMQELVQASDAIRRSDADKTKA